MTDNQKSFAEMDISASLARQLITAVQDLPDFEYNELVDDPGKQSNLLQQVVQSAPDLLSFVEMIRDCIANPPYHVLLKGLTMDERTLILIIMSIAMGQLRRDPDKANRGQTHNSAHRVQIKPTYFVDHMHSDSAHWLKPNDVTCLACIQADQSGDGVSSIIDVDTILSLLDSNPELKHVICETPMPFSMIVDDKIEVRHSLIINEVNEIRWYLRVIETAVHRHRASVDPEQLKLLHEFMTLVDDTTYHQQQLLQANDVLVVNNRKLLHGRSPINDPYNTQRAMVRTRLNYVD